MMKLRIALAPRNDAATIGVAGAMDRKPAMVKALAPRSVLLIRCFPGRARGFEDIRAANLRKATIDPVNVMPPIK